MKRSIILITLLLIAAAGCTNHTTDPDKDYFRTGVIILTKDKVETVARIDGKVLQIKYTGFSGPYARIEYTGLTAGKLDNIAGYIVETIKFPFAAILLINIYNVKIDILSVTPEKFLFIIKEINRNS